MESDVQPEMKYKFALPVVVGRLLFALPPLPLDRQELATRASKSVAANLARSPASCVLCAQRIFDQPARIPTRQSLDRSQSVEVQPWDQGETYLSRSLNVRN